MNSRFSAVLAGARLLEAIATLSLFVVLPFLTALADPSNDTAEIIDLTPADKVGWTMRNAFAPLTGLFLGGPGYWYSPREIRVETTPPGGDLDLFYVRSGFQKRFEQAQAPIILRLPKRIDAGRRDSITIRAFREGYRQQNLTLRMSGREKEVVLDLSPLPNTLAILSHRYFAGRSTLAFLTKELLEFRVQENSEGFTVVLNETARSDQAIAAMDGIRSPMIEEVYAQQLGEDLLVNVVLTPEAQSDGIDVRSRQSFDAPRELYVFSIDLVARDGGAAKVQAAIEGLASIGPADVAGCAGRFDDRLRDQLELGDLNRALAPTGDFTDKYVRAAMRRLGEVSPGGAVELTDGSRYDTSAPIELEVALSQAGRARGLLVLLESLVAALEEEPYRAETLRSLVAPELDPVAFDAKLAAATAARRDCLAAR